MTALSAPDAPLPIGTPLDNGVLAVNIQMARGAWTLLYGGRVTSLAQRVVVQELFPPGCARVGLRVEPQTFKAEAFASVREAFLERARQTRRVHHPSLAVTRLCFENNNTAYLVLDRPGDETLLERVREHGPLEQTEAVAWARELGAGLETMHASGLAHGGVHPGTILLCAPDDAKRGANPVFADWGMDAWLRRFAPEARSDGFECAFLAPELELDARSDVYSLGATLYYALTGLMPPTPAQRRDGREPLQPWEANPDLTRAVNDAILAAIAVEPSARPQSIGEFLSLLGRKRVQPIARPQSAPRSQPVAPVAPMSNGATTAFDAHLPRVQSAPPALNEPVAPEPIRPVRPEVRAPLRAASPPKSRVTDAPKFGVDGTLLPSSSPFDKALFTAEHRRRLGGVLLGVMTVAVFGLAVMLLPRDAPPVDEVRAMSDGARNASATRRPDGPRAALPAPDSAPRTAATPSTPSPSDLDSPRFNAPSRQSSPAPSRNVQSPNDSTGPDASSRRVASAPSRTLETRRSETRMSPPETSEKRSSRRPSEPRDEPQEARIVAPEREPSERESPPRPTPRRVTPRESSEERSVPRAKRSSKRLARAEVRERRVRASSSRESSRVEAGNERPNDERRAAAAEVPRRRARRAPDKVSRRVARSAERDERRPARKRLSRKPREVARAPREAALPPVPSASAPDEAGLPPSP